MSGDENIYRRIINVKEIYYQRKILPFLKFSETCSEHSFALKWHQNIDNKHLTHSKHLSWIKIPVESIFYFPCIFWDINYKNSHCSYNFFWGEKKQSAAREKSVTKRYHLRPPLPPHPLSLFLLGALRNGWMIPKAWATMKQQKII